MSLAESTAGVMSALAGLLLAITPVAVLYLRSLIKRTDTTEATGELSQKVNRLSDVVERKIEPLRLDLKAIKEEVTRNGGKSLKDAVLRLEDQTIALNGKFRLIAAGTNAITWESDADGKCVWASPAMCRMLMRDASEVLGDAWRSFVYQPDRPSVIREWDEAIKQSRPFSLDYRWVRGDGKLLMIHAHANRITNDTGKVLGWLAFVTLLAGPMEPDTYELPNEQRPVQPAA